MKRRRNYFKITAWLAALLGGWILIAPLLANVLIVQKPLARADAILVLAGSATFGERTRQAAALYKNGQAPRILLTDDGGRAGWSRAEQRNTPFVELARRSLIDHGVPPESIEILEPPVAGTIDEALVLRQKIATEPGLQSIMLVTSSYHTRRALHTFERICSETKDAGNENGSQIVSKIEIGISGAPPGDETPLPYVWWLSSFGWNMVAGEYLKSIYYWAFY